MMQSEIVMFPALLGASMLKTLFLPHDTETWSKMMLYLFGRPYVSGRQGGIPKHVPVRRSQRIFLAVSNFAHTHANIANDASICPRSGPAISICGNALARRFCSAVTMHPAAFQVPNPPKTVQRSLSRIGLQSRISQVLLLPERQVAWRQEPSGKLSLQVTQATQPCLFTYAYS
jgi:hypothetical protein